MKRTNIHRRTVHSDDDAENEMAGESCDSMQRPPTEQEVAEHVTVTSDEKALVPFEDVKRTTNTRHPSQPLVMTHDSRPTEARQTHDKHTTVGRQRHDKHTTDSSPPADRRTTDARQTHDKQTRNARQIARQKNALRPSLQAPGERAKKASYKTIPKPFNYDLLRQPERGLFHLFAASCGTSGSLVTKPFRREELAKALSVELRALEQVIRRLRLKTWLPPAQKQDTQPGPGGFAVYRMHEPILRLVNVRMTEERNNRTTDARQTHEERTTNRTTAVSSSSSSIDSNFTPTTTAEAVNARAHKDVWTPEDLDYSMLADIGFGRSQVLQLRSLGLGFDIVQRSLVYFEFELRHTPSGKSIQEPLALLMKRMRQNGCWEAPDEYSKRLAHFQSRFAERDRQLETAERQGAESGNTNDALADQESDAETNTDQR